MLNASEATAAVNALAYPTGIKDKEERLAAHRAYREEVSKIESEFTAWLANEYAPGLPAEVQARIWSKSWEEGHAYGYSEVENHYIDNADFAEFVYNAKK